VRPALPAAHGQGFRVDRLASGTSLEELVAEYGLTQQEVEDALAFERAA
jgi:uncharacterized protein (DUF433 family)